MYHLNRALKHLASNVRKPSNETMVIDGRGNGLFWVLMFLDM